MLIECFTCGIECCLYLIVTIAPIHQPACDPPVIHRNILKKNINIVSTNIKLGSSDDGQLEPVLKGDITVEYLKIIVKEIANLATALKTIQVYTGPNVVGVPDAAIQGPAKLAALNLEEVLEQLDSIKSNFVKTT